MSRLRWAATKIGLVSVTVLVMTAIYAGMLTWWITPVIKTSGQRFAYIFFDIHGVVVFGYALFALASASSPAPSPAECSRRWRRPSPASSEPDCP